MLSSSLITGQSCRRLRGGCEGETVDAWKRLAKMGLLVEHSLATVLAASEKLELEDPVLVLTGSGLKTL